MNDYKYTKDDFKLVNDNEKLTDKAFQTKQLTYFQDAMRRFAKNKYNVIATAIVVTFILMSIFVPIFTPNSFYNQTNAELKSLPPRIPLLESFGVFDGFAWYKDQPIDYSTVDEATLANYPTIDENSVMGYPTIGFGEEYFDMASITNKVEYATDKTPQFLGGTNQLYIDANKVAYAIIKDTQYTYYNGATISVDLKTLDTGMVEVYFGASNLVSAYDDWSDLILVDTITSAGVTEVDPTGKIANNTTGYFIYKFSITGVSNGTDLAEFNSITYTYNDDVVYSEGYSLSQYKLFSLDATENGRYVRFGSFRIVATFQYNLYEALFADYSATIGKVEYEQILADNPGMADTITYTDDSQTSWTFAPGYPITQVNGFESKVIAGKLYTNYYVMVSGAYQLGFETVPYFFFGTDVLGRDLFSLVWFGLRTSLILGFTASAINIFIGIIWGSISGYYGGQTDILMERFTDIWGSFPQITVISILTVLMGPGFTTLLIFVIYDGWIGVSKITRMQFYRYKGREYILAARTLGAGDRRIIFKHILPNALGTIVTRVVLSVPSIIFLEVNLSYLNFGIGNGRALTIGPIELTGTSIGVILNDGKNQLYAGKYWMVLAPAFIISILMITFNMFGNALRDALNPQLRGNE